VECKHRIDLLHSMKERKQDVGEELKKVSLHTGRFINAAVWNAGVMQRMETSHLYERTLRGLIVW